MKRDTPDKPDPNPGPLAQSVSQSVTLSPAQIRALGALAQGQTYIEAAKAAGVDRQTLYRWRRDADFGEAWARIREGMRAETIDAIVTQSRDVLASLVKLATGAEDEKVRLLAAQDLLQRLDGATERGEAASAQQTATVVIAADDALAELRRRRSEGEGS